MAKANQVRCQVLVPGNSSALDSRGGPRKRMLSAGVYLRDGSLSGEVAA